MNHCIESIIKYVPPKNTGYRFIKKATVFIPYQEVGLSILERKEVNISFVYETILKLISQGVNDINQMAILLGLDIDIYKEIISQMAVEDLVTVSEMSITLAPKGKHALQDLIKIVIAKCQVNRIFTNMITGEICSEEYNNFYDRPRPSCMCLDHCKKVDIQFFRDHFSEIENIYSKNKVHEVVFKNRSEDRDSLYRILDIAYQETKYLATNCFIYINDDDSSLLFSFENDKNSIYAVTAMKQISDNVVGALKIFKQGNRLSAAQNNLLGSSEKELALKQLVHLLEQRSKTIISTEEIEAQYYTDRCLLDGEIRDLLMNCSDYKPKKIILMSVYMKEFLQDNILVDMLLSLNYSTTLTFFYNDNEYGIDQSVKWILDQAAEKDKKRLIFHSLSEDMHINYTTIICNPGFVINVNYEEVRANKHHPLLREIAEISFDIQKINEIFKELSNIYGDS